MVVHSIRFSLVLLGSVLCFTPNLAFAASEAPTLHPQRSGDLASRTTWIERMLALLGDLYARLGGDPQKIQEITSIQGRMGLIADQYVASGIPANLSDIERGALVALIDELHIELSNPPPSAPPHDPTNFFKLLRLMWSDLGQPPEELGM